VRDSRVAKPSRPPFDWRVFADATCAGLTPLVPLPLVDVALEMIFRRRLPASICKARGVTPAPGALQSLGRGRPLLDARGCLLLPLVLGLYLLKRLWRKLLYFLTLRETADTLSAYWHRAYLVDHLARHGHLSPVRFQPATVRVFEAVLAETRTGALTQVAMQTARGTRHALRMLLRARRGGAAEVVAPDTAFPADQWPGIAAQMEELVARFEQRLAAAPAPHAAGSAPGDGSR
jgi:hypothetical protein